LASYPGFLWVPDVYEGSATPITLYLSGVVKLAVFSIFVRILF
jgi:NADH-quinone oxidoreductase subunit N